MKGTEDTVVIFEPFLRVASGSAIVNVNLSARVTSLPPNEMPRFLFAVAFAIQMLWTVSAHCPRIFPPWCTNQSVR